MRLACRKCGREYELPADLTARGIYQITCKACGLPVSAEAADHLRQAAGMDPAPRAAAPRPALAQGGGSRRATTAPSRPPSEDQYVDLFDDSTPDGAEQPAPPPLPQGEAFAASPAAAPLDPKDFARAPERARPSFEVSRGSRTAIVFGGGVALLVVLVVGGLLLFRRPAPVAGPAASEKPRSPVISTVAPPLAAPDPEVAAAEAREEAERYGRLRESLRHEAPPPSVERRPAPASPAREPVPTLVGAVRPPPAAMPAQVPQVPAQRETLHEPIQPAAAEPAARAVAPAPSGAVEEAPAFPTTGFEKPAQLVPGCVRNAVRLPRDLAATVSGTFTVRFAVGRDGSVSLIQVMDHVSDSRISDAIAAAVQSCEFRPGTDASGKPTRMWVVMPLRFVGG